MATEKIQNILNMVYEKVNKLLEFGRFYVALYDNKKGELEFPLVRDDGSPVNWTSRPYQVQKNILLPDLSIQNKSSLAFNQDIENMLKTKDATYWPGDILPLSWLGVPMVFEDRVIGVLVVENRIKSNAFSESDVRLLETVARQTTIAIENSRLYERLARKNANLRVVNEIGIRLTSGIRLGKQKILELIYEQASRLMDTKNMYIALYEPDQNDFFNPNEPEKSLIFGMVHFKLMFVDGIKKTTESRKAKIGEYGRTEEIIRTRNPIFIATRAESINWYTQIGHKEHIGDPFASWIGVPMITGEKVLGAIATYHKTDDYIYDDDHLLVLKMMANQSAVAIDNASLYFRLEEGTKQLQELNERLEVKVKEIRSMTVLGEASAGLIHKISNSLGLIPNWVNKLFKEIGIINESVNKKLNRIRDGASDALIYTSGLAKIVQLMGVNKELADISLILEKSLATVVSNPNERNIFFETSYEPGLPEIFVNTPLLRELFLNIIRNAVEAMYSGGKITASLKHSNKEKDGIEIRISDTGCGISDDNISNVFRFGFSTKTGGTGIGLWFCQKVIQQHQGTIEVNSREREGTEFTIFLPKGHPDVSDSGENYA